MKRARLFWIAAWSMQAIAWFVRVHREGVVLPDGLPGWEAWWLSTGALLHPMATNSPPWFDIVLWDVSSISTVLFLCASPALYFRKSPALARTSAWIALAFWILNSHWMFLFASTWSELRIGYYLWWLSFGVLSAALFLEARARTPKPAIKVQSASA